MRRTLRRTLPLAPLLIMSIAAAVNLAQDAQLNELRAADDLWNDGNYIAAITAYIRLLNSPAGDRYVERIALQTGELFVTEEVTADGRNPRLSPDGRYVSYETGPANALVTRIQRTDENRPRLAEFSGTNAAFSPDSSKVAYIRIPVTDELTEAQKKIDTLTEGPDRTYAQQVLARLQSRASRIVVRNLDSQAETELNTGDLLKQPGIVFGADNETVYFVGASENERRRNDIYAATAVTPTGAPVVVTDAEGFKTAPIVSPSGKTLIVNLPNQTPFPVPQPPPPSNAPQGQGQRGQQRGEGNAATPPAQPPQPPPARFGVVDLGTRKITTVTGSAPAFSKDGGTIVYLNSSGSDNFLLTLPDGGTATTVLKTTSRLAAPTFSLDGKKIAYQRMNREDWEVFVIDADGKNDVRVTRDIGHDVLPRFISENRILAASGEPRHRRSFVYDLPSMQQTRLFANTSVRTIAPEYLWMPAPDGSKIFVSADRDGDTISVERGLYLVDLNRRIDKAKLNERLQKNLTSETLLKEFGQRIFEPIDDHVRRVVAGISESRLYEYEKMLTSFDSRNVSQPGNAKAIDYISETLKSFGYETELQWFELRAALGGKTANVLARLPGTESPEVLYILSAHLDSVAAGPGADDDASGIAALLEAARVLRNNPMPATILFAAFTAEESGTLGSREFARVAKEKKWRIAGGLNNDMIGYANDYRLDNTIRYSNVGIRDIQHSAAMGFSRLITYDARYYRGTDALPLNEAFGEFFGGIGGYPILISPHYHQANDVIETLNFAQIAETAKTTVASLMYLASAPSPVKDLAVKGTEITWSPSLEKNIRSYTVSYGRREERVSQPRINLTGLKPGDVVMVRATNTRGMHGWDWARLTVPR
jgi:hypothetical protein